MKLLLNSKFFFAEMSNHRDIMICLTKLLISKNSIVALLASMVLRSSILHFSEAETEATNQNRQVLIKGRTKEAEALAQAAL